MIECTSKARLGRSLNTRTLPAGDRGNYKTREEVDYYFPPSNIDTSGWTGPAVIADIAIVARGMITARHIHNILEVRLGHVRMRLHLLILSHAAPALCYTAFNIWD